MVLLPWFHDGIADSSRMPLRTPVDRYPHRRLLLRSEMIKRMLD